MDHVATSKFKTWPEIKEFLLSHGTGWVFRGQANTQWRLCTTLERYSAPLTPLVAEELISRRFKRNAHAYLHSIELPQDALVWLALMQHHGAPTRLLDWTTSPFVAAFFAVEEALSPDGTSAMWAIDATWCRQQGSQIISSKTGKPVPDDATWTEDFQAIFVSGRLAFVMPIEPYRRNARLTIQNGTFLCPGDINAGFEANFAAYDQSVLTRHVIKVEVPNKLRQEILQDLNLMNINRATLFPGMDGFAQSLKVTTTLLERPEQTADKIKKRSELA